MSNGRHCDATLSCPGRVKSAADARKAQDIANAFLGVCRRLARRGAGPPSWAARRRRGGGGSLQQQPGHNRRRRRHPEGHQSPARSRARIRSMLKVTVAEVQRNAVKQLGVDLNGGITMGAFKAAFSTDNPFPVTGVAAPQPRSGRQRRSQRRHQQLQPRHLRHTPRARADRHGPHARRADVDRDLRRIRRLPRRRRIPGSDRS